MKINEQRPHGLILRLALVLVLGAIARGVDAQVSVQYNTTINTFLPAGIDAQLFDPVPGQTVTYLAADTSASSAVVSSQGIAACGIFPSGGCTQGPGAVTLGSRFPALYGLTASYTLQGGNNTETGGLAVHGTATGVPSTQVLAIAEANDLQQLNINYTGSLPAPTTVGIDINYSLGAVVEDTSTATPYSYVAGAAASVSVLDPATYNPAGGLYPFDASIQQLFDVNASAASVPGANVASASASTTSSNLLSLAPNKPYWVEASTTDSFLGGSPFDGFLDSSVLNGDSINVELGAAADPTFTIDPTWLSENPQYAGDISISQSYNGSTSVPEPSTWLLFGAGLLGLLITRQKNARGQHLFKCRPRSL